MTGNLRKLAREGVLFLSRFLYKIKLSWDTSNMKKSMRVTIYLYSAEFQRLCKCKIRESENRRIMNLESVDKTLHGYLFLNSKLIKFVDTYIRKSKLHQALPIIQTHVNFIPPNNCLRAIFLRKSWLVAKKIRRTPNM